MEKCRFFLHISPYHSSIEEVWKSFRVKMTLKLPNMAGDFLG
jgi:hypothetical protein